MKERPIIFSGEMVRAILEGRKTQTRRLMKPQPERHQSQPGEWWFHVGRSAHWWGLHRGEYLNPDGRTWSHLPCGTIRWREPDQHAFFARHARCPYGVPGDRLWVRETMECEREQNTPWFDVRYLADLDHYDHHADHDDEWFMDYRNWYERDDPSVVIPSIHMPKWATRLWLTLTGVEPQRLQDISEEDAVAEGFSAEWANNDWVWTLTFKSDLAA